MACLGLALLLPPLCAVAGDAPAPDSAAAGQAPPADPWLSPEIAAPQLPAHTLRRPTEDGAGTVPRRVTPATTGSWARTLLSLAGVVALIVLLGWGYRLVMGQGARLRLGRRGRTGSPLEVVSRLALSPRQSVCLLRIGPRIVLVGLTPDRMCALDVITDAELTARLAGTTAAARDDGSVAAFRECLDHAAKDFDDRAGPLSEEIGPTELPVARVRAALSDTLQRVRARIANTRVG